MRTVESRLNDRLTGNAPLVGCLVDMFHKLRKIYFSIVVDIDLLDKILQLLRMDVSDAAMQNSHYFLPIDQSIPIIIEQFKGLLELRLTEAVIDTSGEGNVLTI